MLKALYGLLKSVRLAIVLILLLIALSLLSTLVPQGQEDAFYQSNYPTALYRLIVLLDFNHFFQSLIFGILAALFAVNLGACTVDRFVRRIRAKAKPRYGPDIVHLGLLLLIAGALVTGLARQATDLTMAQGDLVKVTNDYSLRLVSFQFLKYANGSPRAWISTVEVIRDGVLEKAAFPIRVNHPLRLRGAAVYQTTYGNEGSIGLLDPEQREVTARIGQGFEDGGSYWYLADIVDTGAAQVALFQEYRAEKLVSTRQLALSETLGPYTLVRAESKVVTGLRVVRDPGYMTVLIALIIMAAGLALTFLQKQRDSPE